MPDNTLDLPSRLEPAPRGSKRGWRTVSGEIPPGVYELFDALSLREGKARTDLVCEAVELLLQSRSAAA